MKQHSDIFSALSLVKGNKNAEMKWSTGPWSTFNDFQVEYKCLFTDEVFELEGPFYTRTLIKPDRELRDDLMDVFGLQNVDKMNRMEEALYKYTITKKGEQTHTMKGANNSYTFDMDTPPRTKKEFFEQDNWTEGLIDTPPECEHGFSGPCFHCCKEDVEVEPQQSKPSSRRDSMTISEDGYQPTDAEIDNIFEPQQPECEHEWSDYRHGATAMWCTKCKIKLVDAQKTLTEGVASGIVASGLDECVEKYKEDISCLIHNVGGSQNDIEAWVNHYEETLTKHWPKEQPKASGIDGMYKFIDELETNMKDYFDFPKPYTGFAKMVERHAKKHWPKTPDHEKVADRFMREVEVPQSLDYRPTILKILKQEYGV